MAQDTNGSGGDSPPPNAPPSRADPPKIPSELYDSYLRLVLALISESRWDQLALRTGIECPSEDSQFMHLFVEVDREAIRRNAARFDEDLMRKLELLVPASYLREFEINPEMRTIPVRIELNAQNFLLQTGEGRSLEQQLAEIVNSGIFTRISSAIPHGRCLEESLAAIDLPVSTRTGAGPGLSHLTGENIVIGIIDDGCAFAHPDFLEIETANGTRTYKTRVLALWDQSQHLVESDEDVGWKKPEGFGYGRELAKSEIDKALHDHASTTGVSEDAVYTRLRYNVGEPAQRATHGTGVMGIAAGNGNSLMGHPGVAPRADIIFVQLPPNLIRRSPQLLSTHIVHGAKYVFDRAQELGSKAAVVNISYGGYSGPHDGTSGWEKCLDELLALPDRAIVVSAGNGFEEDCHATAMLKAGQEKLLRWIVPPGDTTRNALEIWYNGDAALAISLTPPDGSQEIGPFAFCSRTNLVISSTGAVVGSIEHAQHDRGNNDNSVLVALNVTAPDDVDATSVLAPAGLWRVRLRNVGNKVAEIHGWIHRDDVGNEGRRQQSRFVPEDASPDHTIGDFATGKRTISAGAFNAATNTVCAYSACGPTRASGNGPARKKPDICAPAEELATGAGVLTTASRRAPPHRMNGTSAAAPHVAGIVALAFDHRRNHQDQHLTADELRAALSGQVGGRELAPDPRQKVDGRIRVKQRAVWADLIGAGKISGAKTLKDL